MSMRLITVSTALTIAATGLLSTPAIAATGLLSTPAVAAATPSVVYGFAWSDGAGALRVLPRRGAMKSSGGVRSWTLKALAGAKEVRLDYRAAVYNRVTTACDLVETEGHVALTKFGFGKTRCTPADLTYSLVRAPVPARIVYQGTKAVSVSEFLTGESADRTQRGTITRVNDTTFTFTGKTGTEKLGYVYTLAFNRATAKCGDAWLSGKPANADKKGRGTRACDFSAFTKALKSAGRPVPVELLYNPLRQEALNITEISSGA